MAQLSAFSADGVQVRTPAMRSDSNRQQGPTEDAMGMATAAERLVREPKFVLQHVKDASYIFVVLHNLGCCV